MTTANKIKLSKAERELFARVGRAGGRATVKKRGKKYMKLIAKKGATARWQKKREQDQNINQE